MNDIIAIEGLTKKYGDKVAVNHLNLHIKKGEVFGLLGPNGAGKSTTILMILGLSEPSEGTVQVCGFHSTREPIKVKGKVGYLPDQVGFYENRTGLSNLLLTALLNGFPKEEAEEKAKGLLEQVGLSYAMNQKVGTYSRGMRQRLGLADVLIKDPEVIILDEPTLGIDPTGVQELLQLIRSLSKEKGITVLLSSHHLHQVQQICDRVGLFVSGKLLAQGTIETLAKKLLGEEGHQIQIKANGLTESLVNEIKLLNGVRKAVLTEHELTIWSVHESTLQKVVEVIISAGVHLKTISQEKVGLDEIYQRYFEGSEG
ncbi:hypothetical protein GCM10008967_15880 [Bacillus carboniphilus]|uniref:ABC transporter domain-containing protein n=1 Tax=Bacillus carboniphilus TaxID=86663 RepID=A0ABP3FUA1_9BACI